MTPEPLRRMPNEEKLKRAIESLRRISACVCFRVMVGEWPEGRGPCPDCVCITCDARGTLLAIGEIRVRVQP
jgi:hypothetical protein